MPLHQRYTVAFINETLSEGEDYKKKLSLRDYSPGVGCLKFYINGKTDNK